MSVVDYRKCFSGMRGGAFRGVNILSSPVKPRIDIGVSEDNLFNINEIIDKIDKFNHSSLALLGHRDATKARLINYIAYESKRSVCFVRCDEFINHYIGETEKNISALFARAESEAWIFYLHRADVLFGNNLDEDTDANTPVSHSANERAITENNEFSAEPNYLLGRFAKYPCAVLLSLGSEAVLQQVKHRVDHVILT